MAITAERLMVEVDADTSKAERGLEGFSDKGVRSFGWVGAAGAAVAGLGVAAAAGIGITVSRAGDLEQSVGAVDSVFRESAGVIHEWAQGAATAVGLSTDAYNSSASVIGAMLTNYGVAADQVAGSTNDLIGYGSDLAAMFGGTTEEAVSALGAALRGEADPAERFGLSLSKAKVEAHMAATGIDNATEATLDLIQSQMEASGAIGQFAREGETLQGAQQRLAAGWTNVSASIGELFLPSAAAATGALASGVPYVQRFVDGLAGIQALITSGDFTGDVFGWSEDSAQVDFILDVREGLIGVRDLITTGNFSGSPFGWAEDSAPVDFILDMRDAFVEAGGGLQGLLAGAQAGVQSVVDWLSTGGGVQTILDTILGAILAGREALFNAAMQVFPAVLEGAVAVLPGLVAWVTGVMLPQLLNLIVTSAPMLLTAAVTLFTGLIGGLTQVIPALVAGIATLLPQLLTSLIGMVPAILTGAVTMFTALVEALATVVPVLLAAIVGMLPGLVTTILGMIPGLLTAAVDLFLVLVDAVLTMLPDLLDTLAGDVLPALLTAVLGMLPQLLQTGITLFVSLVTAITRALPRIVTALIGILPTLIGTILGMVPQLVGAAVTLFLALVTGVGRALPDILRALAGMGGDIIREVGNIDLAAAGKTILDGFLRGLKSGFEAVKDFVGGIGTWIAENKGPKAYDLALLQPAGGWIMQGFGKSLASAFDQYVAPVVGGVAGAVAGAMRAPGAVRLTPAAVGAHAGAGGPTTLVFVDADGTLIGRMRGEAGKVATGQVTPLDVGRARW